MSILNMADKTKNPCTKYIKYGGSDGKLKYWDGEKNVNVELKEFYLLEEMGCISGFDEKSNSGIWSNELYRTNGEFTVKSKGGEIAKGSYKDIKDQVNAAGGKYTASVYALLNDEIVNIKFSGAGLGGWLDRPDGASKFSLSELTPAKKGSTNYFVPVFTELKMTDSELEKVKEKAQPVADFLGDLIAGKKEVSNDADFAPADTPIKVDGSPLTNEDLPF